MATFSERFPSKGEIVPVFASCVFSVFSWSIVWFLNVMPGWLLYLSIGDILGILAYTQAFALLESSLILFVLIILAAVLPTQLLRLRFVAQGSMVVFVTTFWLVLFQLIFEPVMLNWSSSQLFLWLGLALTSIVLACILIHRSSRTRKAITALAERLTVFLYVYIPLGILGLLIVIIRNIL